MKSHLTQWSLLLLFILGVQLRAGAQPPPPPVELKPEPAQLAPQGAMPASPETPGVAGADSYYGTAAGCADGSCDDGSGYGGPASRGLFGRGLLGGCGAGACGNGGCGGGLLSSMPGVWTEFEVLAWWNKGRHLQPLVTTSPGGTAQADAAIIGSGNTTVLFGDDTIGNGVRPGGRINVGLWLDSESNVGIGNRFTSVKGDNVSYDTTTDGSVIVGRPFYNVLNDARDASLIGFPGQFAGQANANSSSSFQMNDFYARLRMSDDPVNRIDFLIGYEYARIADDLWISSSTTNINAADPAFGLTFNYYDEFRTVNKFDGVLLGLRGDYVRGRAKFSWLGKVAYGSMHQQLQINGIGSASLGGGSVPLNGGLLALPTNIGTHTWTQPVFVPEINLNLHFQLTQRLDFSMGYSFLYFTNVLLAGDQVDRRLNLSQQNGALTGQAFPTVTGNQTDYWYQGINFGLNGTF